MSQAAALLHQYLAQLAARGVTHVPLDVRSLASLPRAGTAPETAPASLNAATKSDRLAALALEVAKHPSYRAPGTWRETMVPGSGSADAELMFIGEAPGAEEERRREPFVGPAGQLLTRIIQVAGFKRDEVYLSNICKFRPALVDGKPQADRNRPPTPEEMSAGLPFIIEEIRVVQPRVIIALGAIVGNSLGIEGAIETIRGRFHEFQGIPVMVTHNPSQLLQTGREPGLMKEKRRVWEDFLQVLQHLGRPVTAKQRAYFTNAS